MSVEDKRSYFKPNIEEKLLKKIRKDFLASFVTDTCTYHDGILKFTIKTRGKMKIFYSHDKHVMRCSIWYYLYNFTKINTPPWVLFTFLKLYKWYQIAQRITYNYQRRIWAQKHSGIWTSYQNIQNGNKQVWRICF